MVVLNRVLSICSVRSVSNVETFVFRNLSLMNSHNRLSQIPQVFPVAGDGPGVPEISTLLWITD